MKITERSSFRVEVTFRARTLADLGLTGVKGQIIHGDLSVSIAPQRLGDFGSVSMSDARVSSNIERDYEDRCNDLLDEIRRQRPVASGQVVWTEEHCCSFCKLLWEVLAAEDIANFPSCLQDEHSVEGEPVCCDKAIAEFRAERGIPALADEVTSGGAAR